MDRFSDPLAWLSAITAILAVWIAYQQHRATRVKLKLDLFDRRIRVYDGLKAFLAKIFQDATVENQDVFRFAASRAEAPFVFGPEVRNYLDTVAKKAVQLRTTHTMLSDRSLGVGPKRTELAEQNGELLMWFLDQTTHSGSVFARYLAITESF